ncbi:hypothetical protein [Roseibium sp.]|uniref:hypothetical protein n=1 Tax=Roseibium sp. TaxID=1936156 RepID=UPI0039F0FF31
MAKVTICQAWVVHQNFNLFSQTFRTLNALRSLAIAYFAVTLGLSLIERLSAESLLFTLLHAPFGVVFGYYFICQLLGITKRQRRLSSFTRFAFWNVLLMYVVSVAGIHFLDSQFYALPTDARGQVAISLAFVLALMFVFIAPGYLFGTALPAQIFGKQKPVGKAVGRAIRQSGYLLPRTLGILLPFLFLIGSLSAAVDLAGPEGLPITHSGEVNGFSFLLQALSSLLGIVWDAIWMVVITNAYLKDLRESGEIPAVDAEVFA